MEFSKKVILLRKQKGYTQDTFAKEIGVSRQSVYKWEAGQAYPEVEKLVKLGKILEISLDDLLNDEYVVEVAETKRARRVKKEAVEAPVAEAPVAVEEAAPAVETAPAAEEPIKEEPRAKKGFFGRLFGR